MKKYNEMEKSLLLKKYIESGTSYGSFAKSHSIPVSTFAHILQDYGNPDLSPITELMKKEILLIYYVNCYIFLENLEKNWAKILEKGYCPKKVCKVHCLLLFVLSITKVRLLEPYTLF